MRQTWFPFVGPTAFIALLTVMISARAVDAQTTLYVFVSAQESCTPPRCQPAPGVLLEIDVEAARIRSQTPIPNTFGGFNSLTATPDGRYLIWTGTEAPTAPGVDTLNVFDRLTRTSTAVVRRPIQSSSNAPSFTTLIAHPSRLRVFARFFDPPAFAIDPTGVLPLDAGGQAQQMWNLTASGDTILLGRPDVGVLLNTDTGAQVGQVTGLGAVWVGAISPSGTDLYRAVGNLYRRYDVSSGTVVAEGTPTGNTIGEVAERLYIDPRSGKIFSELANGSVQVITSDSLDPLARLTPMFLLPVVPFPAPFPPDTEGHLAFDAHRPRAFLLSSRTRNASIVCCESTIDVIDTDTLTVIGGGQLPTSNRAVDIVVVPRPPQPTGFSAHVDGSSVTLQWTPGSGAGLATGYKIAAGSAPGLNNLAVVDTGTSPVLVATGVLSGTYFVRVYGTNFEGSSDASNEIIVNVP